MFICGGNYRPGPRDECPHSLHDYPLPSGYIDAGDAAARRFRKGWTQKRCTDCQLYGWLPGRPTGDACDQRVQAPTNIT